MSKKPCVVGIDIGTSSCKTLAIDEHGEVVASSSAEYPVYTPFPGWSEQDPLDWWNAVKSTFREVAAKVKEHDFSIEGIGLTGQMHGLVLLDAQGKVLRPCILWNDQRSAPFCDQIHSLVGGKEKFMEITNNIMLPGYTGGKLLWVRENEPQIFEKADKFLCPKDFIRFMLTGELATDVTDASGTGLFDVKERKWATELIKLLGLPFSLFPLSVESHEKTGVVAESVAKELGINPGVPVFGGGGDAVVQTVGMGAVDPSVLAITLGTAGIVAASFNEFRKNPGETIQFFCNAMPESWIAYGTTLAAGGSLRWFRDTFAWSEDGVARWLGRSSYELLGEEAALASPFGRGLVFLPYLIGERCPHNDPFARGALVGFGLHSSRNDFLRSVFEGIVYSLKDVLVSMEPLGLKVSQIRLAGGGARSPLFRKLHATIFGSRVVTVESGEEGGSYGAAIIAGVGAGIWQSVSDAVRCIKVKTETDPDEEMIEEYAKFFEVYRSTYKALKDIFKMLNSFQK
ncbi:MAG: xylulokinase [Candidatus Atribacteria bacterium]|uniref:Xylulose kinase n=1 Tax=Thermatribacter velox TaxID=3039681 RepID=A0ABZ2YG62_9BACT|nr:xylulokinase [Candidatus Atribacteria bacterium]